MLTLLEEKKGKNLITERYEDDEGVYNVVINYFPEDDGSVSFAAASAKPKDIMAPQLDYVANIDEFMVTPPDFFCLDEADKMIKAILRAVSIRDEIRKIIKR